MRHRQEGDGDRGSWSRNFENWDWDRAPVCCQEKGYGKREKGKLSIGYGLAASTTNNIHTHIFSVRDTNGGTFAQTLIDRSNLNIKDVLLAAQISNR